MSQQEFPYALRVVAQQYGCDVFAATNDYIVFVGTDEPSVRDFALYMVDTGWTVEIRKSTLTRAYYVRIYLRKGEP
jgi:hypothetical protein